MLDYYTLDLVFSIYGDQFLWSTIFNHFTVGPIVDPTPSSPKTDREFTLLFAKVGYTSLATSEIS